LVTPFVANGTLYDCLHRGKITNAQYTWAMFLRFASDVASGKLTGAPSAI